MSASGSRLVAVDVLKALAAQVIVLHHLVLYHPLGGRLREFGAAPFDWLEDYGRWAVQVFLVTGGFLAARSLAPRQHWQAEGPLTHIVWRRYLRLVLPLAAVLLAAIAAAALARATMSDPQIPDAPRFGQVLAHLLLLQDLVGTDALTAGVWYIAIDFQLFVFFAALLWSSRRVPALAPALVWLTAALALLDFNRDPALDAHGLYFFGSYALGAFAFWSAANGRRLHFAAAVALAIFALGIDFRERLVVALMVATALWASAAFAGALRLRAPRLVGWLADVSYAQFLIHYPLLLLTNVAAARLLPNEAPAQLAGMLAAWLLTIAAAAVFHRHIEQPATTRWVRRLQPALASR